MKCMKCGAEIKAGEEFCGECGAPTQASSDTGTKPNTGVSENILGLLCYLLGILAIIFWLTEKRNKFIRFHAIQSVLFNLTYFFIVFIVALIDPYAMLSLVWFLIFILWVVLMYKAYKGEKYKLPVIGDYAESKA